MSGGEQEVSKHGKLGELSWRPGEVKSSLHVIFHHASKNAAGTIDWYERKKDSKKVWARRLRVSAIIAVTIAGIIPILAQIFMRDGRPIIPPAWASVALAIAAALVILDRFFGFSSAWMRYIAAELKLSQILKEFRMDWEAERAAWEGREPNRDQVQVMLGKARAFITQVDEIVRKETDEWIRQFQNILKQIDKAAKEKPAD